MTSITEHRARQVIRTSTRSDTTFHRVLPVLGNCRAVMSWLRSGCGMNSWGDHLSAHRRHSTSSATTKDAEMVRFREAIWGSKTLGTATYTEPQCKPNYL